MWQKKRASERTLPATGLQLLLILVNKETVPGKEQAGVVDVDGIDQMDPCEVIVA